MSDTFIPLFEKIVDSSLWHEKDSVMKVFLTMLVLKDRDNIVRRSAFEIAGRAHKTEKEVLEILKILASPDQIRIEPQEFEGRRIERVEGGWKMLNAAKYQDMMRDLFRRAANAERMRMNRASEKILGKHKGPGARERQTANGGEG